MKIQINNSEYNKNILKFKDIQSKIDILKIESAILLKKIEEQSIQEFTDIYTNSGIYPGLLNIISGGNVHLMLVPTDECKEITKKQYFELIQKYGDNIVNTDHIYTLDPVLMLKYGEIIINFISGSKDIDEKDKINIIKSISHYVIKKGTISILNRFCSNNRFTIPEMLKVIDPIYRLESITVDDELDESNII